MKSFVISIIFYALFFTLGNPIYEINDDVFLSMIASGKYTGSPSPYLYSINLLSGRLLSYLYSTFPSINWYSFILYFCSIISFWVYLYVIDRTAKSKTAYYISLILLFISYLRILLFISFTTVAFITGLSGFVLFYFQIPNKNTKTVIISTCLIVLSYLIRMAMFKVLILLIIPKLIYLFFTQQQTQLTMAKMGIAIVLIVGSLNIYHNQSYRNIPQIYEPVQDIAPINTCAYAPNFCEYESQVDAYHKAGWSKNDYLMHLLFFNRDKRVYSRANHTTIAQNLSFKKAVPSIIRATPQLLAIKFAGHSIYILFLICSLLLIAYLRPYTSPPIRNEIMLATTPFICLMGIFAIRGYLPDRIFFVCIFYVGFMNLSVLLRHASSKYTPSSNGRVILLSFYLVVVCTISATYVRFNNENKTKVQVFEQIMKKIPDGDNLTFVWGSVIPYEWQNPLTNLPHMENKHILIGAWTTRLFHNKIIERQFELKNLYTDMINNPQLYIVATEYQQQRLNEFMTDHYGTQIQFKNISKIEFQNIKAYISQVVR